MRPGFLRLEIKIKVLFPGLELNFGTQYPTNSVSSLKYSFKIHFHDLLLSIMETEDDYVSEVPNLLQKIAKSVATTYCTNY